MSSRPPIFDQQQHSQLAAPILWKAGQATDTSAFMEWLALALKDAWSSTSIAILSRDEDEWRLRAKAGDASPARPGSDLLAEASDRAEPTHADGWLAVPLFAASNTNIDVLAIAQDSFTADQQEQIAAISQMITDALAQIRARTRLQRRLNRLEAVLEIAADWNQTHEMIPLLRRMAEAATKLLSADRASIFLWDKVKKILVGRPALGVEGDELRIPDDAGVVGNVVQTGEPARVNERRGQDRIARDVDKQLGYQTETLICVPLRGRTGELFGAFEVLNKREGEFTAEDEDALTELAHHAAIALENTQERTRLLEAKEQISAQAAQGVRLVGDSPVMRKLRATVERVAETDLAVLILGENGTGKEVVAQSVHYLGARHAEPFIAVNCAAISETLLESELFGHEKGAFTGADEMRRGKFELASGGTIFLDEIGDMSLNGQAKLLRVLEEKVVVRVGGSETIPTDARVVAATNQDLAKLVSEKKFREDLYFRLNVVTLQIPPLRERAGDIQILAEYFLGEFAARARRPLPGFTAAAKTRLESHAWPGNVRELRNLMERLAYLFQGAEIDADDLAFILSPQAAKGEAASYGDLPLADATAEFQADHIRRAIDLSSKNMTEAAKRLGLHRSNLYRKMRQLGMEVDENA